MQKAIALLAAALALTLAGAAQAQKIDKNGRCHAKNGQFAKMEVCNGAGPVEDTAKAAGHGLKDAATTVGHGVVKGADAVGSGLSKAAGAVGAHTYKLDAKGHCHDEKGKMAKKAMCAA